MFLSMVIDMNLGYELILISIWGEICEFCFNYIGLYKCLNMIV